jgi:hypothetical protein
MRQLRTIIVAIGTVGVFSLCFHFQTAAAIDTSEPPIQYHSPVFISAFQNSPQSLQNTKLDVIELYNPTDRPVNMNGWAIRAYSDANLICNIAVAVDDVYIPPDQYVVIAETGVFSDPNVVGFDGVCGADNSVIDKLELVSPQRIEETINEVIAGGFARKGLTSTYRDEDDDFLDNFVAINTARNPAVVYAGKWYQPTETTYLQISEILARARTCSPLEVALDCGDYVKLYNPTTSQILLDGLRLRIGYQSQNTTASNAIILSGSLPAGSYGLINKKANGDQLSITDGGGWIWFEDTYGLKIYDQTLVQYPSAGSISKLGWAWAYDEKSGEWKWTSKPIPYNQPSEFVLPVADEPGKGSVSNLTPCQDNQFRNPLTNRCKLLASASNTLTPCASNQVRNPITNRCRLVSATTSTLKACASNQIRNSETNRCKLIASTASSLKPCAENQQRNPETNRCRKIASNTIPEVGFAVKPTSEHAQNESPLGWLSFAVVASLAMGYGAWEWRSEISSVYRKVLGWMKI